MEFPAENLCHMLFCAEAVRKQLSQSQCFEASVGAHEGDGEIVVAEFPHYLPADAARGKRTGKDAILAAADGDGGERAMTIVDCLEKGGALGAVGGRIGGIFNIAALIHRAVGTE